MGTEPDKAAPSEQKEQENVSKLNREKHFPISDKSDKNNHGYGIIAMNSISEKYNSILIIDCTDNVFTVKTNMSIISSEGE